MGAVPVMGDGEMPKETIYEVVRPYRVLQDDGSWKDGQTRKPSVRVEVGWARDCWVRLATTRLMSPDEPTTVDKDLAPAEEESGTWDGQWIELERTQINYLITQLRRARDAAYGRDE